MLKFITLLGLYLVLFLIKNFFDESSIFLSIKIEMELDRNTYNKYS